MVRFEPKVKVRRDFGRPGAIEEMGEEDGAAQI